MKVDAQPRCRINTCNAFGQDMFTGPCDKDRLRATKGLTGLVAGDEPLGSKPVHRFRDTSERFVPHAIVVKVVEKVMRAHTRHPYRSVREPRAQADRSAVP
jgi:hypothetical protein